mmetsp:Transcript_20160/g.59850  ORF Transcript_20160/g.59850 Transcript_20160/m.59850 type:complete len:287 (-) Transcript_20160:751-1611(-)
MLHLRLPESLHPRLPAPPGTASHPRCTTQRYCVTAHARRVPSRAVHVVRSVMYRHARYVTATSQQQGGSRATSTFCSCLASSSAHSTAPRSSIRSAVNAVSAVSAVRASHCWSRTQLGNTTSDSSRSERSAASADAAPAGTPARTRESDFTLPDSRAASASTPSALQSGGAAGDPPMDAAASRAAAAVTYTCGMSGKLSRKCTSSRQGHATVSTCNTSSSASPSLTPPPTRLLLLPRMPGALHTSRTSTLVSWRDSSTPSGTADSTQQDSERLRRRGSSPQSPSQS